MEEQSLWTEIYNPYVSKRTGHQFPAMGPAPWFDANVYEPWDKSPLRFQCPSQPNGAVNNLTTPSQKSNVVFTLESIPSSPSGSGVLTNYVFCFGDGTLDIGVPFKLNSTESAIHSRASHRGIFGPGFISRKFRDVLDGMANTIMVSETRSSISGGAGVTGIAKDVVGLSSNPSLCLTAAKLPATLWHDFGRGSRWSDGALPITGFQTVLPPNSPSCASERGMLDAIASASSLHPDGVHVLMADGAIRFVNNSIEAGDSTKPGIAVGSGYGNPGSPSPYGVWGSMGTRASMEVIDTLPPVTPVDANATATRNGRFDIYSETQRKASMMLWTDKDNKFSLQADFVRIIDKKTIELRDASGILHQVPLNSLRPNLIYQAVQLDLSR